MGISGSRNLRISRDAGAPCPLKKVAVPGQWHRIAGLYSAKVHAAIDIHQQSCDEFSLFRRQIGDRAGNVGRLAKLAQRDSADQAVNLFL